MPGIAGIIGRKAQGKNVEDLHLMVRAMMHEPFYTSGTYCNEKLGLCLAWVCHKDSFSDCMPVFNERKDLVLIFTGENFADKQVTDELKNRGHEFDGSKASYLIHLYEEDEKRFFGELNGWFSGLLVDLRKGNVVLFNDRYGIERLYYYEKDGMTFFASEAKALLLVLPELRAFDDEGVAQFLTFGCTLEGRTLFRNLRFLPGGFLWIFEDGVCSRKEQYFCPEDWESQPALAEEAFELEFLETFRRILPRYASSNSKIGISLTGGLDTRMIMARLPKNTTKPVCYTFSGLAEETLDTQLASRVAQVCGLEHRILRIGTDFLSNFGHYVDHTVFVTDGCAGALGAHEIYLNSQARQMSAVRLTGNFGSEILRSMTTFKPISLSNGLLNAEMSQLISSSVQSISGNAVHPVTFAAFQEIPWNLFGTLVAGRSQLTCRTPYLDNEIVSLAYRSPRSSRMSSQPALRLVNESNPELGRIPTDRGLAWGGGGLSFLMRRLFSEVTFKLDYLHKEGLPHWLSSLDSLIGSLAKFGLLGLHKYLPYRSWFRRELATYVGDVLSDARTQQLPYWNSHFLASILPDHVQGRKNYIREIHAILTLEAAERLLIHGSSEHSGQTAKGDA